MALSRRQNTDIEHALLLVELDINVSCNEAVDKTTLLLAVYIEATHCPVLPCGRA